MKGSEPWFESLPDEILTVAHDARYSDEYLGNLLRAHVGRSPCSCFEAGRDPCCRIHGSWMSSQERFGTDENGGVGGGVFGVASSQEPSS